MTRYFYVSTAEKTITGSVSISSFTHQTHDGSFPSYNELIEASKIKLGNATGLQVIAISEMTQADLVQFTKGYGK